MRLNPTSALGTTVGAERSLRPVHSLLRRGSIQAAYNMML